jgi:hypothetical protein
MLGVVNNVEPPEFFKSSKQSCRNFDIPQSQSFRSYEPLNVFVDELHVVEPQDAIASSFAGFNRRRSFFGHVEVAMFAAEISN